jgi:putrescine transport system permease protein
VAPCFVEENTIMGRVDAPGPDVKLATTTSSSDRVNASSQPETSAGTSSGRVMRMNACQGGA